MPSSHKSSGKTSKICQRAWHNAIKNGCAIRWQACPVSPHQIISMKVMMYMEAVRSQLMNCQQRPGHFLWPRSLMFRRFLAQNIQLFIVTNSILAGCILTLGYDDDQYPLFGWLDQICVNDHDKFFFVRSIEITDVLSHINAYQVKVSDQLSLIRYADLFVKMPLSLHVFNDKPCICNTYCMQSLKL